MEQPCYKCGRTVEEGVPFCPHCSAPQIRVVVADAVPVSRPADATTHDAIGLATGRPSATVIRWTQVLKACALAALIAFFLVLLSVVVAMLAAGFLAITFYRRHRPGIALRVSEAAKIGALAGIFCCCILSFVLAGMATVPDVRTKMQDQYIEANQKVAAWLHASPADVQASTEQLKTPRGFSDMLIEACVAGFLLSIVLGGLGGVMGSAILGRR